MPCSVLPKRANVEPAAGASHLARPVERMPGIERIDHETRGNAFVALDHTISDIVPARHDRELVEDLVVISAWLIEGVAASREFMRKTRSSKRKHGLQAGRLRVLLPEGATQGSKPAVHRSRDQRAPLFDFNQTGERTGLSYCVSCGDGPLGVDSGRRSAQSLMIRTSSRTSA
jgi:hypothetical protein